MAEPARKRVLRPRGGGVGRGVRGGRGARGDRGPRAGRGGRGVRSRAQRSPYGCTMDSVLVDLVSDNDEDIVELAAARGAADPVEAQSPQPQVPATPPDDSDSDSDGADVRPSSAPETLVRQRRRRLQLDPGEAPVVPVYSGKVESSFHPIPVSLSLLKFHPDGAEEGAEEEAGVADSSSPPPGDLSFSSCPWKLRSKDDKEKKTGLGVPDTFPLSSPPRSKNKKHTRALRKLREVNRRLQDLRSCLSPKRHQGPDSWSQDDEVVLVEGPVLPENTRLFPLKVRCRADVVRLPIRMSDPLQSVVDHMASHLGVAPSRILLLFGETELSPTATPRTLKLGVADIIDCVVLASSPEDAGVSQQLRLRVQGKEKHQMLEISLSQDSPLKTLMSHYEEAMGLSGHKLSFFFDGTKLSGKELPADLGMESGDLIEVWA